MTDAAITIYRPYVDEPGVGCGHRAVIVVGAQKDRVRVMDIGSLRCFWLDRRSVETSRADPPENPRRLAARMDRLRKSLKRGGALTDGAVAKRVISALREGALT